jgi:hypothetical protein
LTALSKQDIFNNPLVYSLRYCVLDLKMNPTAYAPTTNPHKPRVNMVFPFLPEYDEPPLNFPSLGFGNFSFR